MKTLGTIFLFILLCVTALSQNITNTLGTSGIFTVKDGSTTFLTLSQSDGFLSLNNCFTLPATTSSTIGVIFKGSDRFIHNYQASGTVGRNTFMGVESGNFTMSGIGTEASENCAFGQWTLTSLTTGHSNSAFGYYSLNNNTQGQSNSAFGRSTLSNNLNGNGNSAFGRLSLNGNTTGNNNSAFGYESLANLLMTMTGDNNSAFGHRSLLHNTTGSYNIGVGSYAIPNNTTGSNNTAIGYNTGNSQTTGNNNTLIGNSANVSSSSVSNEITLGNGSVTTLRCAVTTITALSDARDKKNITELSLGLDFITKLKPRQYNWDKREWYENNKSDGSKIQEIPTAGFIAQELDEVQTTNNAEWLNLVLKNNPDKLEATPGNLLPIMVKAIQELKEENDRLKSEIVSLQSIKEIKEQLAELQNLKEELNEQLLIIKANNKSENITVSSHNN